MISLKSGHGSDQKGVGLNPPACEIESVYHTYCKKVNDTFSSITSVWYRLNWS